MAKNSNLLGDKWKDALSLNNRILAAFGNSIGGPQFHVMDQIAGIIQEYFRADNCAIFWQTDSSDTLELVGSANPHWRGSGDKVVRITKGNAKGGGLTSWLADLEKSIIMDFAALQSSPYPSKCRPDHLGPVDRYSLMSVPLCQGSGTLGLIKCENKLNEHFAPGPDLVFTEDDLTILEQLAVPIALVGRMRLHATAQKKEVIDLVMRSTTGHKDWRNLLDSILKDTVKLLGAGRGEFAWWTADVPRGILIYAALDGDTTDDSVSLNKPVPQQSFIREVFNNVKSDYHLIADVEIAKKEGVPYFTAHEKTRSEIAVRVDLFANPVGVLNLESFAPNYFRVEHVPMLRVLAQQAALAVHQIQRERLVQISLDQPFIKEGKPGTPNISEPLTPIRVASGDPASVPFHQTDHSRILQPILRGLLEDFGYDRGIIYRFDPVGKGLFVAASEHDIDITVDPKTFYHSLDRGSFARMVFDLPENTDPIIERNPAQSTNVDQNGLHSWCINGPILGYPLWFRGQKTGCIVLWCRDRRFPQRPPPRTRLDELAILAAARVALWQAEQELISSMAFFRALALHTRLIIFTKRVTQWKPDDNIPDGFKPGDTKFVFDWANQHFLHWVDRESIKGLTDWDLFLANAREYYDDDLRALEKGFVEDKVEWNIRPRDKQRRHVRVWKHRLPDDPLIGQRIQVVFWDRTDSKKLEDDNKGLLEEKNALLHDLRHRIYECIHHLHAILEDQLTKPPTPGDLQECMVRVQAREAVIARLYGRRIGSPIDMEEFIRDIVKCVEECYRRPGISCDVKVPQTRFTERVAVSCGMIVAELVANAFRHGFPEIQSGQIVVALARNAADDDSWTLRVSDDGIGTNAQPPFDTSAIGLGLVEELVVKQLGGSLILTPNEPCGARPGLSAFVAFSPTKPAPLPLMDTLEPDGYGRVLLVEDDPHMGVHYKIQLKRARYKVIGPVTAESHAVDCVKEFSPAVVVLDVALGGDSYAGIKLAGDIRAFSDVPILFLTRHDHNDEKVQEARFHFKPADYLQKTAYITPHLLDKVQTLVFLHRPPSTVFICYARERQKECQELCEVLHPVCGTDNRLEQVQLYPVGDKRLITWSDREIQAGDNWEDEVKKALMRCAVGILLIDVPWLNSGFILKKELPILLEQGGQRPGFLLLPVMMGPCYMDPDTIGKALSIFQFVDSTCDPNRSVDERGKTDHELKTERMKVWVEITKRVAEFKKQMRKDSAR